MANPHKGEVALKAGGATYTLRFSVNALVELEEAAGKGIIVLSQELSSVETMTLGLVRKVLWAGLREHHPDLDLKAAGELILEAGGIQKVMGPIGIALERAFPDKGQASGPPQKPGQHGTGPASGVSGAA